MITLVAAIMQISMSPAYVLQEPKPSFPIPFGSARRLAPEIGSKVIEQSQYGRFTHDAVIAGEGDAAWFYRGSIMDLKTGKVDEGMRPVLFRRVPGGEFTPIWIKQLGEARTRAGQQGLVAGQTDYVLDFEKGQLVIVMDASTPDSSDPDAHLLPWRAVRCVGLFDTRRIGLERNRVLCAWKGRPSTSYFFGWGSASRKLVFAYGPGGTYQLGSFAAPSKGDEVLTDLPKPTASIRREFATLLSRKLTIGRVSRSATYAAIGAKIGEKWRVFESRVRSGERQLVDSVTSMTHQDYFYRYQYIDDTLVDRGPKLDSIPRIWDRKKKKWRSCGDTRILGASPKGTWILVESQGQYWLLKPKWPK